MRFFRPLHPIAAISFDLDDTLYDNEPVMLACEQDAAETLRQQHTLLADLGTHEWALIRQQVATEQPLLRHDMTALRHQAISQTLHTRGYSADQAQQAADQGMADFACLRNRITVPAESHQVLQALAQRWPLVAITNGNADPAVIGLAPYFSLILRAGPAGRAKPYPDMFHHAATELKIAPQALLHVGDHLETDIQGAIHAGAQACWINDKQRQLRLDRDSRALPTLEIRRLDSLLELL